MYTIIGTILIFALGIGLILDTNNGKKGFQNTIATIGIGMVAFSLILVVFEIIPPQDDEIVKTPIAQTHQTYKISKNRDIYIKKDNKFKLYTDKVETIEYNKNIKVPQVELITTKHYGDLIMNSWDIGKREITYSTRISKLVLPINDLSNDLTDAITVVYHK